MLHMRKCQIQKLANELYFITIMPYCVLLDFQFISLIGRYKYKYYC